MIYDTPKLASEDREVLTLIEDLRNELRHQVSTNPVRWTGFLRRTTFARALQGSNSIEGYNANLADVVAIVDDDRPETVEEETRSALLGYRSAMTYVMRLHDDPHVEINAQLIRSLHYMMLSYDMTKMPGQWRTGAIYVVHEPTGETVYDGPEPDQVSPLVDRLVRQINEESDVASPIMGAMAHLNLVMIHPFKDGNGRMARALQTLVLARNGVVSPVFSSIEEWLGRNTDAYYRILAETGQGRWSPQNDALPWVRFCLVAHYQQAATLKRRNMEIGQIMDEIERLSARHGLQERTQSALLDAAYGYAVRNQSYRAEHDISDVVASRDLKHLSELELLKPVGERRGRYYVAGDEVRAIRMRFSSRSRVANPYDLLTASGRNQLKLPL